VFSRFPRRIKGLCYKRVFYIGIRVIGVNSLLKHCKGIHWIPDRDPVRRLFYSNVPLEKVINRTAGFLLSRPVAFQYRFLCFAHRPTVGPLRQVGAICEAQYFYHQACVWASLCLLSDRHRLGSTWRAENSLMYLTLLHNTIHFSLSLLVGAIGIFWNPESAVLFS